MNLHLLISYFLCFLSLSYYSLSRFSMYQLYLSTTYLIHLFCLILSISYFFLSATLLCPLLVIFISPCLGQGLPYNFISFSSFISMILFPLFYLYLFRLNLFHLNLFHYFLLSQLYFAFISATTTICYSSLA